MKIKKIHFLLLILLMFCGGVFLTRPQFWVSEKLGEDDQAVQNLSESMVLPDEIPTVATVADKKQLGEQIFFRQAENGDKIIMYTTAGEAYLFRPSSKKIIDIAPILLGTRDQGAPTVLTIPE
jgi:hypothetical protein